MVQGTIENGMITYGNDVFSQYSESYNLGVSGLSGAMNVAVSGGGGGSSAMGSIAVQPPTSPFVINDPMLPGIPGIGHVAQGVGMDIATLVARITPAVPQIIGLASAGKWAAIVSLVVGILGTLPWSTILVVMGALVAAGLLAKWIYDKIKAHGRHGRRKRYSIGSNPRMGTLLKVGKKVDNIFLRYDKRVKKFRTRIRGYNPRPAYSHSRGRR